LARSDQNPARDAGTSPACSYRSRARHGGTALATGRALADQLRPVRPLHVVAQLLDCDRQTVRNLEAIALYKIARALNP